ncbi:MAG TPA: VOC family protein [Bacillota bacterium]
MSDGRQADHGFRLPPGTGIGRVRLRVADLERSLGFYRDLLGLQIGEQSGSRLSLAAGAVGDPLIILEELPGAAPRGRTLGLYHFALLVPDRRMLARLTRRLVEAGWPITGASDHGVSEALYLDDPDGNGLELYADRPRERWPVQDGRLAMFTRPLDAADLMAELRRRPERPGEPALDPGTVVGHIHLHVSDLQRAEAFYDRLLGFDVVVRGYPGALFLSAGGYHHHVGANTWLGPEAPRQPDDAAGLIDWELRLPGPDAAQTADRLEAHLLREGATVTTSHGFRRVEDPDGTALIFGG